MNTLESFTSYVKTRYVAQKSRGSFYQEVYERLTNDDDYTIFTTPFQVRAWLCEKYIEACNAQWNNLQIVIRELIAVLDALNMCSRHIMSALDEIQGRLEKSDLQSVTDRESALKFLRDSIDKLMAKTTDTQDVDN